MKTIRKLIPGTLLFLLAGLLGCSDAKKLANYDQQDSLIDWKFTGNTAKPAPDLLSAFFGFDSEAPITASFFVCRGAAGKDASPVVFPTEINLDTLQASDFHVTRADGSAGNILCVTPAPAFDKGELRTILMVGDYGSAANQPVTVEVVGDLLSIDNQINFRGKAVDVVPLEAGPSMVLAEIVPQEDWELGKQATLLPFGGGSGCPNGTRQIVRVTWNGGITKPGGKEVDELERKSYTVAVRDSEGIASAVVPFALGDLGDGDNNHKLCLDTLSQPVMVEFPAGLVTDPRDDPNPATAVSVTRPAG